ncbi:MAG: DUF2065 domain-containing protein [Thermodesulfobacteriota bacterium]
MKLLLSLIGLVLVLEGLPWAAFPAAMQGWMRQLAEASPVVVRLVGLAALVLGLSLCYLAQRSGLVP